MSFMSDECHQAKASPHHTILRTESHASPDPVISIRAAMRSVRQQQLGDHDRRQVGEAGGHVGHDRCASGGNQPLIPSPRKGQKQAKSVLPGPAVDDDS
jgi:hypothetical protein